MESQTNEEYATEAPKSCFDEGKIEESNLPEKKKQGKVTKIVPKPHEKCSVARSQLQALSQLASGVNKLADINVKWLKMKEKGREVLLQKRRSWKNCVCQKEMA